VPKFQGFKVFHLATLKPCNVETCGCGAVAQLGERLVCNQEATGSIPVSSTRKSVGNRSVSERWCVNEFVDRFFALGALLIPIAAIVVGGIVGAMGMIHKHQERLAKIERGIDPDGPWPQQRQWFLSFDSISLMLGVNEIGVEYWVGGISEFARLWNE
jgi:hypothetical protein